MAQQTQKLKIIIEANGKQIDAVLTKIHDKAAETTDQLNAMAKAGLSNTKDYKELKAIADALNNANAQNIEGIERVEHAMQHLATTATVDLRRALAAGTKELSLMAEVTPEREKLIDYLKRIKEQIDKNTGSARKQNSELALVDETINTLAYKTTAELRTALLAANTAIEHMGEKTPGLELLRRKVEIIKEQIDKNLGKVRTPVSDEEKSSAVNKAYNSLGSYSTRDLQEAQKAGQQLMQALKPGPELEELKLKLKAIGDQIAKNVNIEESEADLVKKVDDAYSDLANTTNGKLREALEAGKKAMLEMKPGPGLEDMKQKLQDIETQLNRNLKIEESEVGLIKRVDNAYSDLAHTTNADLRSALESGKKAMEGMADGKQLTDLKKKLAEIEVQLKKNIAPVRDQKTVLAQVERAVKNLAGTTTGELRQALIAGKEALNSYSGSTQGLRELEKNLKRIQTQINKNTGEMSKNTKAFDTALKTLVAYTGLFSAFNQAKTYVEDTLKSLTKMSDKLADIRKVSGLTANDIKSLSKELAKTDTRTSQEEMLGIAYSGAKLGVGEYGTEGLAGFTRAANQVNVALKEDLGDEALTALSKFTENMGLIKKYGIEEAMLKAGSAMFKLSSTSTATSANIVEFTKRMMASGKAAGITADQLLALGSAADSMGLMPEVASTAMQRFLVAMQTNHNLIEKNLGIPKGTINSYYEQGKAMEAMLTILDKLQGKNMNQLGGIWKDLGSEEGARLKNVITAMSNQLPMLRQHLMTSAEAFKEGTAVTAEYNIQQNTANALIERASNLWSKKFVNSDNVDVVHEMAKAWYDLTAQMTSSQTFTFGVKIMFESLKAAIWALCQLLPTLITLLGTVGLSRVVAMACVGIKTLVVGIYTMVTATEASFLSWTKLNAAMKANHIGIVIGLVVALVGKMVEFLSRTREAATYMKGFIEDLKVFDTQVKFEQTKLKKLYEAIDRAKQGTQERKGLIEQFNKTYGQYLKSMLTEASTAQQIEDAYKRVNVALRGKMALEGKMKDYANYVRPALGLASSRWADVEQAGVGNTRFGTVASGTLQKITEGMVAQKGGTSANSVLNYILRNYSGWSQSTINQLVASTAKKPGNHQTNLRMSQNKDINASNRDIAFVYVLSDAIRATLSSVVREQKVERKWKNSGADEYDKSLQQKPGPLTKQKPDKEAERAAKAEERERRKDKREQLKEAEDQSTAIISKIEEYYKLQDTAIEQMVADGKLTREEADAILLSSKKKLNQVLAQARLAISGQKNNFEELRTKGMGAGIDQVDFGEQSTKSLDEIRKVDVNAAYAKLKQFDGDKEADSGAFLDKVQKNAAQNQLEASRVEAQQREKINTILIKDDSQKQADKSSFQSFVDNGMFRTTEDFYKQRYAGNAPKDSAAAKYTAPDMMKLSAVMMRQFRANSTQNYSRDLESKNTITVDGREVNEGDHNAQEWFKQFTTSSYTDKSGTTHTAGEWLPIINADEISKNVDMIKAFYKLLTQADDAYYEAQKKNYDREKKLLDERWNRSAEGKADVADKRSLARQERVHKMNGRDQGTVWQQVGLGDTISSDDVSMAKAEQEFTSAQQKYEMAKAFYDDEQLILEAQQQMEEAALSLSEQVADRIQTRIDKLQSALDPMTQFAQTMGEAFITMGDSAKEGRNMLRRAAADMVKAYAQMTIKMMAQQVTQRIQRALFHKQMEKMEKKHNKSLSKDAEQSGKEQLDVTTTMQTGIADVTQEMNTKVKAAQDEKAEGDRQQNMQEAQGGVFAGIAEGAAKIIGKLGWWGIPLVAVIQALLMGLLNKALSKLGGGSSESASTNTKLVTGMLTYDEGNVGEFRGVLDGRSFPVVGDDGKVYAVDDVGKLETGIVSRPLLTAVNGRPSIVAERGPEMVIGRETTSAMMMSRPDLLREIVQFDRHRSRAVAQTFDSGNVGNFAASGGAAQSVGNPAVANGGGDTPQSVPVSALDAETVAALQQLAPALAMLTEQLKQPLRAKMDMWGKDGAYESLERARNFMKKYK